MANLPNQEKSRVHSTHQDPMPIRRACRVIKSSDSLALEMQVKEEKAPTSVLRSLFTVVGLAPAVNNAH